MDDTIVELQIKLEHQAEDIAALNKELYAQQKELAQIKQQMNELKARLLALGSSSVVKDISEETPPPHY